LRSGLIAKRTAPAVRSKEYAKKIRQARMRLNESESSNKKTTTESGSPVKEKTEESKNEDNDGDFLDMHTDVNFEEDEDEPADKTVVKLKDDNVATESIKEEVKLDEPKSKKTEVDSSGETPKPDKEKSVTSKRSLSKDKDKDKKKSDVIFDLTCIHCTTKCMTVQVS
jgi:hypothetical protein